MIIVTGGAGFIGSAFARKLNQEGHDDLIIVDELKSGENWKNLRKIKYLDFIHKDDFLTSVLSNNDRLSPNAIIHMGACSSTTESNADYMMKNNFSYTKSLAAYALSKKARFIYASSAATYGDGTAGYSDSDDAMERYIPLNVYGYSKQQFDLFAKRSGLLSKICGLKFFNVFGPNEYHKEDMRSVVLKSYMQIKESGSVSLFRSHRADYADGEQKRDFVYVKDCCDVIWWLMQNPTVNGIFNLGTGKAESWNSLVSAVFEALEIKPQINYIDMPEKLRGQYQYFTQADMGKLRAAGYTTAFHSLKDAVKDYVCNHLQSHDPYL